MTRREQRFPAGWDEARVQRVLDHYEGQGEDEAVAEDEAAFGASGGTMMPVPPELVPEVQAMIERYQRRQKPL